MDFFVDLFHRLSDLEGLIRWGGLFVLTAIVFTETADRLDESLRQRSARETIRRSGEGLSRRRPSIPRLPAR